MWELVNQRCHASVPPLCDRGFTGNLDGRKIAHVDDCCGQFRGSLLTRCASLLALGREIFKRRQTSVLKPRSEANSGSGFFIYGKEVQSAKGRAPPEGSSRARTRCPRVGRHQVHQRIWGPEDGRTSPTAARSLQEARAAGGCPQEIFHPCPRRRNVSRGPRLI
jgi:hypothetical protein